MITETDERVRSTSNYFDEFKKIIPQVFKLLIENKKNFEEYDWGMNRVQVKKVVDYFDNIICEMGGFELDARSLRHAHGIGNNNEYDIVDKNLVKVGNFYCNNDMFGGVYIGVELNGEVVKSHHLK